jgi:receptor protein-tyrosine kinase
MREIADFGVKVFMGNLEDTEDVMERENNQLPEIPGGIDLALVAEHAWCGIKKYWKGALTAILLYTVVCILVSLLNYSPTYCATATIEFEPKNVYGSVEGGYDSYRLKMIPDLVSSNRMEEAVADQLGCSDGISASISAEVVEGVDQAVLSVVSADPQLAYDVLQASVDQLSVMSVDVIGGNEVQVLDSGSVPTVPSNQRDTKYQAGRGFAQAVLIALAVLIVYSLTRHTVLREEELKEHLQVPCLGKIPKAEGNAIWLDPKITEPLREVRNRLIRMAEKNGTKSFIVTSVQPGEGATSVAVNLALSLAKKKKRVALIDGDLRHQSVAAHLGMKAGTKDLTAILNRGEIRAKDFFRYQNLELLVLTGNSSKTRTVILPKERKLSDYIHRLEEQCDYVIVDTPACGRFGDALQIGKSVDGAILVVRQDYTDMDRIAQAEEQLRTGKVPVVGCLLNGVSKHFAFSGKTFN